jgi:hypothetical protein
MTPTTDQPLPDHIGRYRVLGRLGAGGMGTVYRAHDPHLERIVAVKVPRLEGPPEERAARVQRFQREARAAARILHPNVCPIFDVGEHDGAAFVVMAYVEGMSLEQVLAQRGPFDDLREAVALVAQVLDALAAVHAQGIVHRDVKPGNILLDAAGRCILADFGLARPEELGAGLTSEGVVIGTPAYMAPEQAAGRPDQIGPWTDLYAVGVVLFQLLTGRLPFEGGMAAVLGAVVRDEPPSPRTFRPDVPADLEAVILRALRKDPRARFVDARDFRAALGNPTVTTAADRPPDRTMPEPARQGEPWRGWLRRRLPWLPGAASVAAGGAVVAMLVLGATAGPEQRVFLAPLLTVLVAVPLMLVGLGLWSVVEQSSSPEGVRYAAKKGLTGRVREAAVNGVPLDLPDEMGRTALMRAAGAGHKDVVEVLLRCGADPEAVSSLGQTAIDVASARGRDDIVALLKGPTRPVRRTTADPGAQPSGRRWLVSAALLGAMLVVGYDCGDSWVARQRATQVSFGDVLRLMEAKQVKTIECRELAFAEESMSKEGIKEVPERKVFKRYYQPALVEAKGKTILLLGDFLEGEVKSPSEHPQLRQGRFWAEVPAFPDLRFDMPMAGAFPTMIVQDSELRLRVMGRGWQAPPSEAPRPAWALALALGVPALLAALLGWPLGSSWWFPVLRPVGRPATKALPR